MIQENISLEHEANPMQCDLSASYTLELHKILPGCDFHKIQCLHYSTTLFQQLSLSFVTFGLALKDL